MRENSPITVTLGELQDRVEARVRSGAYDSASAVVRAGLRALEREEAARDEALPRKVREALDDTRPSVPADEAFAALRARHAGRMKAAERDV